MRCSECEVECEYLEDDDDVCCRCSMMLSYSGKACDVCWQEEFDCYV